MNLLQKVAAAAAKKAILKSLVTGAPVGIKSEIESICGQPKVVDALQQAMRCLQGGDIGVALIDGLDIPPEFKEKLRKDAVLAYLNASLSALRK